MLIHGIMEKETKNVSLEMTKKETREYQRNEIMSTRDMLKSFLSDEQTDKALKPAIQQIISACLQFEFIVFCQDSDESLTDGVTA